MITIGKAQLDFQTANEDFAHRLYADWDHFCRYSVEKVIDDTLSAYDREEEIIRVESMVVDLGKVTEADFYEDFPRLLAAKLKEVFESYLRDRGKYPVEVISLKQDQLQAVLFFLLYGYFSPEGSGDPASLSRLFQEVLEHRGQELVRSLRMIREKQTVRRRLVWQLADQELERLVEAAEPSGAVFINLYVRYMQLARQRLEHPEMTATDYRNTVWEVVLAYLLFEGGSFFSRKQLVVRTIRGLAARFNIDAIHLLRLLTHDLKKFTGEWVFVPELLRIFSDIQDEWDKSLPEQPVVIADLLAAGEITDQQRQLLRRLLSEPESCHRVLVVLTERETEKLLEYLVPEESPFIIGYARELETQQERGMLEGQAGNEFRVLKWEFIFLVLFSMPAADFQRGAFVLGVIYRLAAHYNLPPEMLLTYLWTSRKELPVELARVLEELYDRQSGIFPIEIREKETASGKEGADRPQLLRLLARPLTARKFLAGLPEKRIRKLVRVIIPSESTFIILYALTLDREHDRGMLQGKAGPEFRLLKWEFIFSVLLSAPTTAFSRKQFVRAVLYDMANHYNVEAVELLTYFYRALQVRETTLSRELTELIGVLWEEEQQHSGLPAARDREAGEKWLSLLEKRGRVADGVWEKMDATLLYYLLEQYTDSRRAELIRQNKEGIALRLFRSPAEFSRLCREWLPRRGFLLFLMDVYGREFLSRTFAGTDDGVVAWLQAVPPLRLTDWLKLTPREMILWVKNKPEIVKQLWQKASPEERRQAYECWDTIPELQDWWEQQLLPLSLQRVIKQLEEIGQKWTAFPSRKVWSLWIRKLADPACANLSCPEIWSRIWNMMKEEFPAPQQVKIAEILREVPGLASVVSDVLPEPLTHIPMKKEKETLRLEIQNAGLVLLSPYFPRLFQILEYTQQGEFVNEELKVRAVFLLQYILDGSQEAEEPLLLLNKLLVGWDLAEPLPVTVELDNREQETALSLLEGAMHHWDKMVNTSLKGFRQSFLVRNGILQETGDFWQLAVEEKAYDVLLDALPWTFSPVKYPWMEKSLYVNWR